MTQSLVIVGGEPLVLEARARTMRQAGFEVEILTDVPSARLRLAQENVDILAVDVNLLDQGGAGLIEWALGSGRALVALGFGGQSAADHPIDGLEGEASAKELLALAAEVRRPFASDDTEDRAFWRAAHCPNLIGESPELLSLIDMLRNISDTDCPVLITGESGTGKELVARALHDSGPRQANHFVALNCAAIPESLIEAELFGHARGAFTGAHVAREGRFLAADGGTLFLDEIGDMPLVLQAKLLRVLQERMVTPIGDSTPRPVDVRIIAATHQDLESLVEQGKFRADLYYRLNVIPLRLPALRERRSDIPRLASYFLERSNKRLSRDVRSFDPTAVELLCAHHWPGNIRELSNLVERMVVLKGRGTITAMDLSSHLPHAAAAHGSAAGQRRAMGTLPPFPALVAPATDSVPSSSPRGRWEGSLDLRAAQEDLEKQLIQEALARTNGNRTEAAALLGLNRTTLVEKLRKIA